MMRIRWKLAFSIVLWLPALISTPAKADPICGTVPTCRAVVSSVDALKIPSSNAGAVDYSTAPYAYITVTCYHEQSSLAAICGGGGDFDRLPFNDPSQTCQHSKDDQATVILDGHQDASKKPQPDCFYRKNFGLNGVVDARQCGVHADGASEDGALLNNCMLVAAGLGLHIVSTGGGVVMDNTGGDIAIPGNMELTCGGNGVSVAANNDYRINGGNKGLTATLTNAIVLDPTSTIALSSNDSSIVGCTIEAGVGADGANKYSPSVYYPSCTNVWSPPSACPVGTPATPLLRSALNEYDAFKGSASVGITVTGDHDGVRDSTVLGFGTCYLTSAAQRPEIDHLKGDCDIGLKVKNLPDATEFNGFEMRGLLTGSNGAASLGVFSITTLGDNAGQYKATVALDCTQFAFVAGDTIWVSTTPTLPNSSPATGTGYESAGGRWTVGPDVSSCLGSTNGSQSFTLVGSISAYAHPITATGNINSAPANATAVNNAMAITGVVSANMSLIAQGQVVTDTTSTHGACIPSNTTVVDVWAAKGIVYLSAPATCTYSGDVFNFTDNVPPLGTLPTGKCSANNASPGCVSVDADMRFGDGVHVENSNGLKAINCQVYEHIIAYHMYTGTNGARFVNCATGENQSMPDNAIVGLQIDGKHDGTGDGCDIFFANSTLGQHRPTAVLVNSDCNRPNQLANVVMSGTGAKNNGTSLELDAGVVSMVNSSGGPPSNLFVADYGYMIMTPGSGYAVGDTLKGTVVPTCSTQPELTVTAIDSKGGVAGYNLSTPATCSSTPTSVTWTPDTGTGTGFQSYLDLAFASGVEANAVQISNNSFPNSTLYLENATAAAETIGCGDVFKVQTPYLCAPPVTVPPPGGRLTVCATPPCAAVVATDVPSTGVIWYVPYVSQSVPIWNGSGFISTDIGALGVSTSLNNSAVVASNLYDIFAESSRTGGVELCVGTTQWSPSSSVRPSGANISQVSGIWVNGESVPCQHNVGPPVYTCPAYYCTYLGTMYAVTQGKATMQVGPDTATGGPGLCVCLYNAYNRVPLAIAGLDNHASYSDGTGKWQPMNRAHSGGIANGSTGINSITVVDGLGEMAVDSRLDDLVKAGSLGAAQIGLNFDSTSATPAFVAQNQAQTPLSQSAVMRHPPSMGVWYVQAMEFGTNTDTSNSFGGSFSYPPPAPPAAGQQLSVNIND